MKLGPGIVLLWNASHRYHPFTLDSILTDSYMYMYGTRIIVHTAEVTTRFRGVLLLSPKYGTLFFTAIA